MTTFTPAVLTTGADERGNLFSFWKSPEGWVDGYNERITTENFIRSHVFPNVQKVYFSNIVLTGAEWVEAGCPMSLTDEQMTAIEQATVLEAAPLAEQVAEEIQNDAAWLGDSAPVRRDEYSIPLDLVASHNAKVNHDVFTHDADCQHLKAYPTYGGMMCKCGAKFEPRNDFERRLVASRNPRGNGYVNWQFR